jgi:hypothetical protein
MSTEKEKPTENLLPIEAELEEMEAKVEKLTDEVRTQRLLLRETTMKNRELRVSRLERINNDKP